MKNFSVAIFSLCLLSACSNFGQLTFIAKLPNQLDENSGIVSFVDSTAWFILDKCHPDKLYQVDFNGNLLRELKVKNAKNHDWEDLAKDKKGNLYIGDFGNNTNSRKNLVIYKLPNPEIESGDKIDAGEIRFNYLEQKDFPPKKNDRYYDAEALFHHGNHLYIITKNRANPFTGEALLYKVPDAVGVYNAEYIGKFETCDDWESCQITAADISPDEKKIALLSYGKLWIITDFTLEGAFNGSSREIDLGVRTQLESVCFLDDNTLLISDEERANTGRNLYSYTLEQ